MFGIPIYLSLQIKRNNTMNCNKTMLILLMLTLGQLTGGYAQLLNMQLFELEDVIFEKIETPKGYEAAYKLKVKQPLDHQHPEKGHFYQTVWLSHKGYNRPTTIITNGYYAPANRVAEISALLGSNQVSVEHRYFGPSSPKVIDYQYLNMEQVAADLHHIRTLLGKIYEGKWVSSGISKGGQTTIMYRYFYPKDVVASVPYVAPLNLAYEDERIYTFLDTVGTDACRQAIKDFQIRLLKNQKKIMPMLKWYSKGKGHTYEYLGMGAAFEYAVLEYSFSFWQWGEDCADVPGKDATIEEDLAHLLDVIEIGFFADKDIDYYATHYYQAGNELGYYGYATEAFTKYLKALPTNPHPHAVFSPKKRAIPYEGKLAQDVSKWLASEGNRFIYIYGGNDTWSATRVPESDKVDALWYVMPGKHHGNARIRNLTKTQKREMITKLESWLEQDLR